MADNARTSMSVEQFTRLEKDFRHALDDLGYYLDNLDFWTELGIGDDLRRALVRHYEALETSLDQMRSPEELSSEAWLITDDIVSGAKDAFAKVWREIQPQDVEEWLRSRLKAEIARIDQEYYEEDEDMPRNRRLTRAELCECQWIDCSNTHEDVQGQMPPLGWVRLTYDSGRASISVPLCPEHAGQLGANLKD